MRNLGPIVGILLGIVGNTRQDRSTGSSIALQLVGDDPGRSLAARQPSSHGAQSHRQLPRRQLPEVFGSD
jgi:hypothetical protein